MFMGVEPMLFDDMALPNLHHRRTEASGGLRSGGGIRTSDQGTANYLGVNPIYH